MVEAERSVINATLEIRIEDFSTATKECRMHHAEDHQHFAIDFCASIFPNGIDEDTEGWLVALSEVNIYNPGKTIKAVDSLWILSIIDIEGNSRFPRYFGQYPPGFRDIKGEKYLEKSFILNREDEFLSEGMLLLRYDIYFYLDIKKECVFIDGKEVLSDSFASFLSSIPQIVCLRKGANNPRDNYKVFDLTSQILSLPQFHWLRKGFGVKGIAPVLSSSSSETKVDRRYIRKNIWTFDTRPDRFFLSLARHPGNVGRLLLIFSPVIRRCVNVPMKEQREKRIELSNVDSVTFQMVLYFLESGRFPNYRLGKIAEVYKFSHLYGMEYLQQKCVELMVEIFEDESELEEIAEIANLYSDEYLLTLLKSHQFEFENSDMFRMKDRPDSDCFI